MELPSTRQLLNNYGFIDGSGEKIDWTPGQINIIAPIVHRNTPDGKNRVQIMASTRYGKSISVAAALSIRASLYPEQWAIVAGTKEKARIIMEYVTMFSLDTELIRTQLEIEESLDRLRMRRSQDRLNFKRRGEIRVYSADATKITETSKSLMGFGAANIVEDESALIPDQLQATVMRMLGDSKDNFMVKIGNPFNRNHFYRTWNSERYHKIFIDYKQGLEEGRYSQEYIDEMREEPMFGVLYENKFPEEGAIDEKGWLPLLTESEIERSFVDLDNFLGDIRLGADVSGGGRNYSTLVLRSHNFARKEFKEQEPDTMNFVTRIVNTAATHVVRDKDVYIDKVGVGKGAYDRLRQIKNTSFGFSGGDKPSDSRFANLRAEAYWRAREWILHGGKLLKDDDWYQLAQIKYKVNTSGKLIIMPKEEMLKQGIDSPDVADAFVMTFARNDVAPAFQHEEEVIEEDIRVDPYARVE